MADVCICGAELARPDQVAVRRVFGKEPVGQAVGRSDHDKTSARRWSRSQTRNRRTTAVAAVGDDPRARLVNRGAELPGPLNSAVGLDLPEKGVRSTNGTTRLLTSTVTIRGPKSSIPPLMHSSCVALLPSNISLSLSTC